ncbi:hypothetical protein FEM08_16130 [Flavobacterium gilvum]|nr:hypothetical protein FEM08_16130 [Flavobacterium gilvum]
MGLKHQSHVTLLQKAVTNLEINCRTLYCKLKQSKDEFS